MNKMSINFDDKKINKSKFYKNKKLFKIDNIDADKILISKKESYGKYKKSVKYFIGYDNNVLKALYIKFAQMIGYFKCFSIAETMFFKVNDKKLLKSYAKIWEKISNLIGKEFDSEPVYRISDKYIKASLKIYEDINTNFQSKKIPKENISYKCLTLILLDSIMKRNKKYDPETLLEE